MTTTLSLSLRMPPPPFRVLIAAAAAFATLLVSAPAQANERVDAMRNSAAAADRALAQAQDATEGRGPAAGRELTLALAELESRRPALSAAERREADELLARPTDAADVNQPGGPYTAPPEDRWIACTVHFCFHWVTSTADAPPLAGSEGDGIPDYLDLMADAFETAYQVENQQLGWRTPKPDAGRGWDNRPDVYVKDIGQFAYGYVARDPGQEPANPQNEDGTRYAFLVMDDDYSASEFPKYGGQPEQPVRVTAAHEYNHVLQNAYDSFEDKWMFESTATWMEEVVEPGIDDYHQYVPGWTQRSLQPITAPDSGKIYGSAVWNRWLHDGFAAATIRDAWAVSFAESSFAPGAYDRAIRDDGGAGFMPEFIDFAVATAEWGGAGSGIHEGGVFPSMARVSSGGKVITLPTDGSTVNGVLDHTGYALFEVAPSSAPALELTGSLPAGTAGAIALVGRSGPAVGGAVTKAVAPLPGGGQGKAVLQDPGRFSRITAVIVNADPTPSGWDAQAHDWIWAKDDQAISLGVKAASSPGGGTQNPGGGTQTPGGATQTPGTGTSAPAPQQPSGGAPAGGGLPAVPVVKPIAVATRLSKLARSGVLVVSVEADRAGSLTARASLGSRKIGTGRAALAGAGRATLKIRLTPKAKAALRRARKAAKVDVRVTFTPAGGRPVAKTLKLTLRR